MESRDQINDLMDEKVDSRYVYQCDPSGNIDKHRVIMGTDSEDKDGNFRVVIEMDGELVEVTIGIDVYHVAFQALLGEYQRSLMSRNRQKQILYAHDEQLDYLWEVILRRNLLC